MRYAVALKSPDRVRRAVPVGRQRAMRGPMLDSDEMMWANGMTETEDEGPATEDTFIGDATGAYLSRRPDHMPQVRGKGLLSRMMILDMRMTNFDRDLVQEFEKAECATQ